jgi:thiol-disulfide isomerase/thioredoxin
MQTRRTVLAGLAALAAPVPARADDSPIAHGVLADNPLARAFEKPPTRTLPDVPLVGLDGTFSIERWRGRTVLMPLWAEWCAPCMSELPDFGRLHKKYSNTRFTILPVLSGTSRKMTPHDIAQIFSILKCDALPALAEDRFGNRLIRTMGRDGDHYSLPCNLIIAPDGTVVGREMGRITAEDASAGPAPEKTGDPETITRAIKGQAQSVWGKPEGEAFAAAMANGFFH